MSFEDGDITLGTPEDDEQERVKVARNIEVVRTMYEEAMKVPGLTPRIFFRGVVKEGDMMTLSEVQYEGLLLEVDLGGHTPHVVVSDLAVSRRDPINNEKIPVGTETFTGIVRVSQMEEIAVIRPARN